jgi:hypothetical protein
MVQVGIPFVHTPAQLENTDGSVELLALDCEMVRAYRITAQFPRPTQQTDWS